jgi:hypothetical protein
LKVLLLGVGIQLDRWVCAIWSNAIAADGVEMEHSEARRSALVAAVVSDMGLQFVTQPGLSQLTVR